MKPHWSITVATALAVVCVASTANATTVYYRVSDLGAFEGAVSITTISPYNSLINPDGGWTVRAVYEYYPTGQLIGSGQNASLQFRYLGLTPLNPGDATADGRVDGADLAVWQRYYGASNATFFTADWNDDGRVDGGDLALWQQNYRPSGTTDFPYSPGDYVAAGGAHMPEPMTMLGLFLGLGSVGAYIRKRRMA